MSEEDLEEVDYEDTFQAVVPTERCSKCKQIKCIHGGSSCCDHKNWLCEQCYKSRGLRISSQVVWNKSLRN